MNSVISFRSLTSGNTNTIREGVLPINLTSDRRCDGFARISIPNGGPLQREDLRQKFSLYSWKGPGYSPSKLIDDLSPYTLRPEGLDLMSVGGSSRILFVEDRYQATGYATRNAVHWPTNILGNIP